MGFDGFDGKHLPTKAIKSHQKTSKAPKVNTPDFVTFFKKGNC